MRRSPRKELLRRVHGRNAPDQMRRLIDFVIACVLLVVAAPLMLLVAAGIKIENPGPILVRQSCIGVGGRRFQMLRFRTTRHDPEQRTPIWARKPTRIGEVMRYTRIDALPELINVLRGEMSITDADGRSP